MPIYTIQGPDGKTYDIEGPDGATAEQLGSFIQSQQAPKASGIERFGEGLLDPIHGGAQLLTKALPTRVVEAGNRLNNMLAESTGMVSPIPEGGVNQMVQEREKRLAQEGIDWPRMAGNVLSPVNLAIASMLPAAGVSAGRITGGAVGGGASGAMAPVEGDDFWADKKRQIGASALAGGAMPVLGGAVSRAISPRASVNPDVKSLNKEGVNLTIGQTLGGIPGRMEEKLTSVPFLGDSILNMRQKAVEDFNRAAINRAVSPLGESVDEVGQEGVKKAGDMLSKAYGDAIDKLKFVKFDQQFSGSLDELKSMASGLEPKFQKSFEKVLAEKFGSRLSPNGSMLGDAYKKVYSDVGKLADNFSGMENAAARDYGSALKQLHNLMRQQVSRGGNPEAASLMSAADEGWANLVRVEGAAKSAMNAGGLFTPAQLNMAVRQADTSVRDRATARGTALMQDLGTAGQRVIGNKIPNSGTIDRGLAGGGLGAAAIADPMITGSVLGAGLLGYTPLAQRALSASVSRRPEFAQPLAESVRKAFPFLIPAGAGLLNK